MPEARLLTLPFSHYCEKARWALDATGVAYHEDAYMPGAHARATRAVGGKTVPVLVDGATVLCDSTDIALYADSVAPSLRRLVPEDSEARGLVLAIEEELDETLGKDARLIAYAYQLGTGEVARRFLQELLRMPSPVARLAAPIVRALIFRAYRVTPERTVRAKARVRETFERLGERLRGAGYLVGGSFTLADLTLAALATPLLSPPEHPVMGHLQLTAAPELEAFRAELLSTPTGEHAMRMYREHRRAGAIAR